MNEAYDEETDERAAKASGSTTIDRFEQSRTSVVSHRQVTVTYPARASVRFPGLRVTTAYAAYPKGDLMQGYDLALQVLCCSE